MEGSIILFFGTILSKSILHINELNQEVYYTNLLLLKEKELKASTWLTMKQRYIVMGKDHLLMLLKGKLLCLWDV